MNINRRNLRRTLSAKPASTARYPLQLNYPHCAEKKGRIAMGDSVHGHINGNQTVPFGCHKLSGGGKVKGGIMQ